MRDERDELLEEIERILPGPNEDDEDIVVTGVRDLIEKARAAGVVRYPRP